MVYYDLNHLMLGGVPVAQTELKKSLGVFSLIALGVSGVIGSSWIYTNGTFFDNYGAGGMIFGLALGSLLAAFVALAYAELTALFPRAGGEVVYGYAILGRRWGFIAGWLLIGAYVSSLAFYFTAFGLLLDLVFPFMHSMPLYSIAGQEVSLPVLVSGLGLTLLFFLLNYFGVSVGAQVQTVLFAVLIGIGICLAAVGFAQGSWNNFWPPFYESQNSVLNTLRFVVPGMTYMAGFGLIATLAEDANLPPKKIGRLVVFTVLLTGAFYCVVLTASAFILPWEEVAKMEQGTITAFQKAGYPILGWGAFAIAILGLLTSFLGLFMATSRIVVALARVKLMPSNLAKLHPSRGTPVNALLFVAATTIGLGWLGKAAVVWFLDTGGIYLGLVWILMVVTLIRLPYKYPHLAKRRMRALPFVGAIGALLVIVLALFPGTSISLVWPAEYIILAIWAGLGGIFYLVSGKVDEQQAIENLLGNYSKTLEEGKNDTKTVA